MRSLSLEVATKLLDVLVVQYPALREAVRSVAGIVMEQAYESALEEVDDLLAKEKDPFTVSFFVFLRVCCHVGGFGGVVVVAHDILRIYFEPRRLPLITEKLHLYFY